MARWPWVDRRFEFSFPVGKWPDIVERLRGTPARLEERLRGIDPRVLTTRVDGGWTIQENAGHLADLDPLWVGRLDDFLAGLPELRPADMSNEATFAARHNERPIGEILALFRQRRERYVSRLEALDESAWGAVAMHPRLKSPMRLVDACFFTTEHDDYHLARISELLRQQPITAWATARSGGLAGAGGAG